MVVTVNLVYIPVPFKKFQAVPVTFCNISNELPSPGFGEQLNGYLIAFKRHERSRREQSETIYFTQPSVWLIMATRLSFTYIRLVSLHLFYLLGMRLLIVILFLLVWACLRQLASEWIVPVQCDTPLLGQTYSNRSSSLIHSQTRSSTLSNTRAPLGLWSLSA